MRTLKTKVDRGLNYNDIRNIFFNEGRYDGNPIDYRPVSWVNPAAGSTTSLPTTVNLNYNMAVWVDRLHFSCTHAVKFDVIINYASDASAVGTNPYVIRGGRITAGGQWERQIGSYFLGSSAPQIIFRIYKVEGSDFSSLEFTYGIDSYTLFEDTNFFAESTVGWAGDSISWGAGVTDKTKFYPYLIKKYIENSGFNRRLSIRAFRGCTSKWIDQQAESGAYSWPNMSSFFYALGTNDALQGLSATAFKANVAAMIARLRINYPDIRIYILTPPPLMDNTAEANAVVMRQKAKEAVSEANWGVSNNYTYDRNSRAFCIDLGAAFDRTVGANYFYVSSNPDGVHPSNTGSPLVANAIKAAFAAIEAQVGGNFKLTF